MQMKNKLKKIRVAAVLVACCVLFFALHGRAAFSDSTEAPLSASTFLPEPFNHLCGFRMLVRLDEIRRVLLII